MPADVNPVVDEWYCHLDKGQRFRVVAVDEAGRNVEVQDFDGTVDELDFETWYRQDIKMCEAPENWSGALDIDNEDDFGTEITDTRRSDWNAPFDDFETKEETPEEE